MNSQNENPSTLKTAVNAAAGVAIGTAVFFAGAPLAAGLAVGALMTQQLVNNGSVAKLLRR